jgi:UDP-N-acetyl-D-mannosaminuronic acid transferase (WecB/TagA/CpsF family)
LEAKPVSLDAIIENLKVSALSLSETAELICHNAGSVSAQNVFTLNLDHLVKMRKNAMFRQAYTRAGLITADGFPIG